MKKAKQFEVQKAVRRLKQAKESSQDEKEISKLESLLSSIKAANIEALSDRAATSVGLSEGEVISETRSGSADPLQIAERRILSARCVVDQLTENVAAIDARRGQ